MLVSMPTNVSASVLGDDAQVIKIMADVGFDAFDISVERPVEWDKFPNTYVMDLPDFKEHAQYLHDLGQSLGIPCCAAHAPCATSSADPEINEILFHKLVRAAEAAAIVGANAIVVHPILYPANHPLREHQWQLNLDLYRRLLPYARDFGIRVAVENLIEWKNDYRTPGPSMHRHPEEFCRFLDELDSEWFTVCLDFGHAVCSDASIPDMIRTLGKERLYMLHVHDNDLKADHHTVPYLGNIDFDACIKALQDIGFDSVLDFEVNIVRFPKELIRPAARFICETGMNLKQRIQGIL